jgi:hypothetical protein
MLLTPSALSGKTPGEIVTIKLNLAPMLSTDTIVSVVWTSSPTDLAFSVSSITDSATSVTTNVGGGSGGTNYTITATCTLASGDIAEPWVTMRVALAGQQ